MSSSTPRLKTALPLLVLFLIFLALAAAATGWYSLPRGGALEPAAYVFAAVAVLAVLAGAWACRLLSSGLLRPLRQASGHFERIAAGDLTHRLDKAGGGDAGPFHAGLKRLQDSLGSSVGGVRASLEQIGAGVQQLVAGNTDLSGRTEQQAAALQQTAASMEQLASTVKQNADNARQANQLAVTASDVAQRGGRAVGEVVATMQGISASSHKISDIVGVIDSIAFQTNILALNAAVEAARAGEQGKGFAVVASEVRALAQRSAHAAKEIKDLIEDSVKKVSEGSGQVERAGATMDEIVDSVARVTDIMGEISAATSEQSTGIDQINTVVAQMDGVTQQNAQLVEQAVQLAEQLGRHVTAARQSLAGFRLAQSQVIEVPATALAGSPAPRARTEPQSRAEIPAAAAPSALGSASRGAAHEAQAPAAPAQERLSASRPALASAAAPRAAGGGAEDDWEEF